MINYGGVNMTSVKTEENRVTWSKSDKQKQRKEYETRGNQNK